MSAFPDTFFGTVEEAKAYCDENLDNCQYIFEYSNGQFEAVSVLSPLGGLCQSEVNGGVLYLMRFPWRSEEWQQSQLYEYDKQKWTNDDEIQR